MYWWKQERTSELGTQGDKVDSDSDTDKGEVDAGGKNKELPSAVTYDVRPVQLRI
jgi:hypothetical protein